eukprot:TRINITY_DN12661_c0_g3_i1.p1 TRINITY_DN12661_c0_g3~~TRINITY_DN12661_c0_g3_i1.p1  ORF type:complete len:565 (+),score=61.21 TRINITY_DN12661_c0_g3_i1:154-1848(+)
MGVPRVGSNGMVTESQAIGAGAFRSSNDEARFYRTPSFDQSSTADQGRDITPRGSRGYDMGPRSIRKVGYTHPSARSSWKVSEAHPSVDSRGTATPPPPRRMVKADLPPSAELVHRNDRVAHDVLPRNAREHLSKADWPASTQLRLMNDRVHLYEWERNRTGKVHSTQGAESNGVRRCLGGPEAAVSRLESSGADVPAGKRNSAPGPVFETDRRLRRMPEQRASSVASDSRAGDGGINAFRARDKAGCPMTVEGPWETSIARSSAPPSAADAPSDAGGSVRLARRAAPGDDDWDIRSTCSRDSEFTSRSHQNLRRACSVSELGKDDCGSVSARTPGSARDHNVGRSASAVHLSQASPFSAWSASDMSEAGGGRERRRSLADRCQTPKSVPLTARSLASLASSTQDTWENESVCDSEVSMSWASSSWVQSAAASSANAPIRVRPGESCEVSRARNAPTPSASGQRAVTPRATTPRQLRHQQPQPQRGGKVGGGGGENRTPRGGGGGTGFRTPPRSVACCSSAMSESTSAYSDGGGARSWSQYSGCRPREDCSTTSRGSVSRSQWR